MSTHHPAEFAYVGTELEVFAHATNWKRYVARHVDPFIGTDVLEVGAGLGSTTTLLCRKPVKRWVCLEPDPRLAAQIAAKIRERTLPGECRVVPGTVADLADTERFDTALYMDVLEHIADDRGEIARTARLLKPNGHLVVLAPAHQWLFSPFDRAIGHHRRYTRNALAALTTADLQLVRSIYLDSAGLVVSAGNRALLRTSSPTHKQVWFWDRVLVPVSRMLDPLFVHAIGKSTLVVWRKRDGGRT